MLLRPGRLTLGIVLPIQARQADDFDYVSQLAIARMADQLGLHAIWIRDVPLNNDTYPDPAGHSDPWVLLGALAQATTDIQLVTGAIVLPLRHPLHIAKSASSMNALSGGRFVLGLGSGDRPSEFAVFGKDFERSKESFRENFKRLAAALEPGGKIFDEQGRVQPAFEIRPSTAHKAIPLVVVGSASQSLEWIARNAVGWATYYRPLAVQADRIGLWKTAVGKVTTEFRSLGIRTGRKGLIRYLREIGDLGANHVMFNLVAGARPAQEALQEIATEVMTEIGAED